MVVAATERPRLTRRIVARLAWWLAFAYLAAVVSAAWATYLADATVLLPAAFYGFNIAGMIGILILINGSPLEALRWIARGIIVGVLVALVASIALFDASSFRGSGLFNNPNQLGYYGVLAGSSLVVLRSLGAINSRRFQCAIAMAAGITLISLSFASIVAFGFVIAAWMALEGFRAVSRVAVLFILALTAGAAILASGASGPAHFVDRAEHRIGVVDEKTADVAGSRGYSRIWEHPSYIVFGAGEGARDRFGPSHGHELHSSLGTALFSYGPTGLALVLGGLFSLVYRHRLWLWLVVSAPIVYSFTHQGLRSTGFWILIALCIFCACAKETESGSKLAGRLLVKSDVSTQTHREVRQCR